MRRKTARRRRLSGAAIDMIGTQMITCAQSTILYVNSWDYERRPRVRAAFLAAADRPRRPFVVAARRAAADRSLRERF
jgi:hypothetical protein